jgi:hypothetical protein
VSALRSIAALTAALLALALASCGGSDDNGGAGPGSQAVEPLSATMAAKAEAGCRQLRRETRQIGSSLPRGTVPTNLEMTTDLLVAPSISVLERAAERQQGLEEEADNPEFGLYAGMFDPIIVLAQQRLAAGTANDATASEGFEAMLTDLGDEQREVAARLGLHACQTDFQHVLVASISE